MIGTMWIIGEKIYLVCPNESYSLAIIGAKGDWHWDLFGNKAAPVVIAAKYLEEQPMPDNLYSIWTGKKINLKREAQTLEELVSQSSDTRKPDHHYLDFKDLPKWVKKALLDTTPTVETSSYTVGEPTAFLRATVSFPDGDAHLEIHIGNLQPYANDWEEEHAEDDFETSLDRECALDAYLHEIAGEMLETFDWEYDVAYFDAMYADNEKTGGV